MRCLQCRKPLAFLKRWSEAEFCSVEHRELYYAEIQRMLLNRLQSSAERFSKLSPLASRIPAPAVPPLAGFIVESCEAATTLPALARFGPRHRTLPLILPRLPGPYIRGSRLAGFRPDLPWPYYNAKLLMCPERILSAGISSSEALRAASTLTGRWNPFRDAAVDFRSGT